MKSYFNEEERILLKNLLTIRAIELNKKIMKLSENISENTLEELQKLQEHNQLLKNTFDKL